MKSYIDEANDNIGIDYNKFYNKDGQQSNATKNGNLWFKNSNSHYLFGTNPLSKFNLFRYNIFTKHLMNVPTNQDNVNYVTKYEWPKIEHTMTFEQCQDEDYTHKLFMDFLMNNKQNILQIAHGKEFLITNNMVIDFGGVSQEAINIFSNNFMKKLYESNSDYMCKECDLHYYFKNSTTNNNRDEVIDIFLLGTIFTLMFTGRCPSLADPTLCASIFNYSENIPINFYDKYPNLHSFLNNPEFESYLDSIKNKECHNLSDYSNHHDESIPKMLCDFCT